MTKTMKALKKEEKKLVKLLEVAEGIVEKESYKELLEACRMMINREDRR